MIKIKITTFHRTNTQGGIIVPFSIHSLFHQGSVGAQKVRALIDSIKALTKKPITVLITEKAHLQTLSILYDGDIEKTRAVCAADARAFLERFEKSFKNCIVQYWDELISKDVDYPIYKEKLLAHYKTSSEFRKLLLKDAHDAYTPIRALEYPNKELFIMKTIEDILEQLVLIFVGSKKGFRFLLYPGNPHYAFEFVNNICFPPEKRIRWIKIRTAER